MSELVLVRRGRLIDPRNRVDAVSDLLLRDGRVAEISERSLTVPNARTIEAEGKWVVPGLVDLHVHLREPGEEGKETILTGCRAAAAGGFTSIVAMPNTRPVNDSALITQYVLSRAAEAALCRVYPAGAISKGLAGEELSELGELISAGCVCITDDGRPVMNAGLMRRALLYAKPFGCPVMVHAEDLTLTGNGVVTEGAWATRLGLPGAPRSAEVAMVARDLILAEETGGRLHVAHVSASGSVRLIRDAKRRGVRVTCEAAPHHFTLTDEAVEGYRTQAKMNPPLRGQEDRQAIREALADGTIDAIATDHAPHGVLDKECEFDRATNGVVGLETAVPLTLELVNAGLLSIERAVALLTCGPADAFGLAAGHLGQGAGGDLTVIDPNAEWTIDPSKFFSKSRNTPFAGRKVKGRVTHTLLSGRLVHEDSRKRP